MISGVLCPVSHLETEAFVTPDKIRHLLLRHLFFVAQTNEIPADIQKIIKAPPFHTHSRQHFPDWL